MSSATHTPGPWKKDGQIFKWEINDKGGASIALIEPLYRLGNDAENEANACLIAAAPELLDALKDWIDHLTGPEDAENNTFEHEQELLGKAQSAIAKAEGRAS